MAYSLIMSARSPFARRARIALMRLGIRFEKEVVDVFKPTESFLAANPLGLVPVLKTPAGIYLPDSASILEYLDETHGNIWPKEPRLRLRVRLASTLAEGIMTATVNHFLETQRTTPSSEWLAEHREALERTLANLAAQASDSDLWGSSEGPTQGAIDLAIALQYLDLRLPDFNWRIRAPSLVPTVEALWKRPEFKETAPPPA
jgi:glutathione S-transferase